MQKLAVSTLSLLAALAAPAALAHDEDLGALAPSCIVDRTNPFGDAPNLARIVALEADLTNLKENPAFVDRSATGSFRC